MTPKNSHTEQQDADERRIRRRRTVRFIVLFLVVTSALLTGYRYAIPTKANHAYLYTVASHTAMVLRILGDSCVLEQPHLFVGQESMVRTRLLAEEGDDVASAAIDGEDDAKKPLSPWELYRYRMLRIDDEMAAERAVLERLEIPRSLDIETVDEHIALLESWRDLLEQSMKRPSSADSTQQGAPAVIEAFPAIEERLDALIERSDEEPEQIGPALAELTEHMAQALRSQRQFVQRRIAQLRERIVNSGPGVYYVARSGLDERIAELESELTQLRRKSELTEEEREARREELQAQIGDLHAEKREHAAEDRESESRTFAFILVPDCGAIPSMSIFVASVLAFPCLWWRRLAGLLFGLPVLYAVNVGRLTCLAIIGAYDTSGEIFDFIHNYVWQGIYVIFVVVVWLLWVELFVRRDRKPTASA